MTIESVIFMTILSLFTFVSMAWNSVQIGGWIKRKLNPKSIENSQFDEKHILMLEKIYENTLNDGRKIELDHAMSKRDRSEIMNKLETLDDIEDKVNQLYKWHDKEDEHGRKLWYFPSYIISKFMENN